MRLFTKYSRVNILASILALVLGSAGYFFAVRLVLLHQLDNTLRIEEAEIMDNVQHHDRLPQPANYRDQQIAYMPAQTQVARAFRNTTFGELQVETGGVDGGGTRRGRNPRHPFRELLFPVRVGGQLYTVSVAQSEEETEDLLELIMLI